MWPIPVLEHKFVSVLFFSDALVCCWIRPYFAKASSGTQDERTKGKFLKLCAYKRYPLTTELVHLMIFNPTLIKKYITSFLQQYELEDAFIAFSLHGALVTESFIAMPTSTPHRSDFGIMSGAKSTLWHYQYLYPYEGQFIFYLYTVPRVLILQYQLLAIAAQCNLIMMTTHTVGLLSTYQHIFGSAFRRSQLGLDMMRYGNNIIDCISVDSLHRIIHCGTDINVNQERLYLATAVGLFCSERLEK